MTKPGPYHNLAAGAAGIDAVEKNDQGNNTVVKHERDHVAALTSDGTITVDDSFAKKYGKELNALSGKGWKDVVIGGISHYDRTTKDAFNTESTPTGFWMAGLDQQGHIHVSPTFNAYNGHLPAASRPYASIVAVQNSKEGAAPAIIGVSSEGTVYLPDNYSIPMARNFDTSLKYKALYASDKSIFGLTVDGQYPCPNKDQAGYCLSEDLSLIQPPSLGTGKDDPTVDYHFGLRGPYADFAVFGANQQAELIYQYLLAPDGSNNINDWNRNPIGSLSEIDGVALGGSGGTLYGITGNPKSSQSLTQMPGTGASSGYSIGGLTSVGVGLLGLCLSLLRRRI